MKQTTTNIAFLPNNVLFLVRRLRCEFALFFVDFKVDLIITSNFNFLGSFFFFTLLIYLFIAFISYGWYWHLSSINYLLYLTHDLFSINNLLYLTHDLLPA